MAEFRKTIGIFPSGKEVDHRIDTNDVLNLVNVHSVNVHKAKSLKRRDFQGGSNDGESPREAMDAIFSSNEVRATENKRRKVGDSSSPDTSSRAATDELSSFSNEVRDGTDTDASSPISIPPPPIIDDINRWNYHIDLQEFGARLQAAARAVFPNERKSRYLNVSVLMLSWADEDPRLPVSQELDALQGVFRDVYHFDTERWEIPGLNSHYKLAEKIMQFIQPEEDSNTHLKIVYYAGHARLMETRTLAWTSWQNQKKPKCAMVKWGAIQSFLEEAANDVLILLDCCASGTANTCEGNGTTELISACAWNEIANGVGPYSLTSALVIELKRLSQKVSFSVGELYRNVFMRTQNRMPEDIPQRGRERERHPAPIHLILTQDTQLPRSIQLSVRFETDYNLNNQSISREQIWEPSIRSVSPDNPARNNGNPVSPCSNTEGSLWIAPSNKDITFIQSASRKAPRLAFAIRLSDTFRPDDEVKILFLEWLREIPIIAQEVKIEACFDSFSTLLIISLPVSMAAYLPPDHAIISLGPIISGNRISHAEFAHSSSDTSLIKALDLDSSGPVGSSASSRGNEPEQISIATSNSRPSPTSLGMRRTTNKLPDYKTILASMSARGERLNTRRSLPLHPRALTIEAALRDCAGVQVKEFALIALLENGEEKTYTSRNLSPQQSKIFTNKFRQEFRHSMRRATAESYGGDSSYESDVSVDGKRPWNSEPDPYGINDDTPPTSRFKDLLLAGFVQPDIANNRLQKRACGAGGSYALNDNIPKPVPIEPEAQIVALGDDSEVDKFYSLRFRDMQQEACKIMGKAFIKLIEPRKEAHYPYTKGEARAPPWWPDLGVRHKEPDHLLKVERIRLLVHILKLIVEPHDNQYPTIRKLGLNVQKLEEATLDAIANWFRHDENARKKPFLEEIFVVAKGQERYKASELDFVKQTSCHV